MQSLAAAGPTPVAVQPLVTTTMARKKKSAGDGPVAGPSQRSLRIGELVRHKVAEMLVRGEIHDDTLAGQAITIPEVRLSPDLKLATIFIMPLGGANPKPVLEALERNKRYIRGEVAEAVNLKFAPDIRFRFDDTFDEASRIDALLDSPKVRQDTMKKEASGTRDQGPGADEVSGSRFHGPEKDAS